MGHPLLCNLHFAYHDNVNCYMVMDLLEGGDLRHHINNSFQFTEKCIAFIAACISSALHHVHSHGIIHRDVKPENIVLDCQGYPRLCDFGISHTSSTASGSMVCSHSSGTLCYLAPEILTSSQRHSTESDFWSLGIVLYELMFLKRPFSKHCPHSFIEFVGNNYENLWYSYYYGLPNSTSRMVFGKSVFFNSQNYDRQFVCSQASIQVNLPQVDIPPVSSCGVNVSADFKNLINGLLDIRIPQRLGSGSNYEALRNHKFFEILEVSWNKLRDKSYTSPLVINVDSLRKQIKDRFPASTHHRRKNRLEFITDSEVSKKEVMDALDEYFFIASQYMCKGSPTTILRRKFSFSFRSAVSTAV